MRNKKIWIQIVAWGICVLVAYRLYAKVQADNKQNAERFALLQEKSDELEQLDSRKKDALLDIFDKTCSQLETPAFVCWGDAAMAGSKDNSLPVTLKKVIEDNLFSQLSRTFSQVLQDGEYTIPSVTVNNMGVTNEGLRQILVRAGVNTMELGEGISSSSGDEPVTVRLMDEEAWNSEEKDAQLKFAKQQDVSFGDVQISDVKGSLITTDDWFDATHPRYAFIRDEDDGWFSARAGTQIEIESATKYIGDIPVFFFENDSGRSVEGIVSDIGKLVNKYTGAEKDDDAGEELLETDVVKEDTKHALPYVVIFTTKEGSDLDNALKNKFGDRYIRNDYYINDMTGNMYSKLAQKVFDNLNEQECFTDIQAKIILAVQEAGDL